MFLGLNFEFQYIFGFLEYDDIVILFWGHHIFGQFLAVISIHFRAFSLFMMMSKRRGSEVNPKKLTRSQTVESGTVGDSHI